MAGGFGGKRQGEGRGSKGRGKRWREVAGGRGEWQRIWGRGLGDRVLGEGGRGQGIKGRGVQKGHQDMF